MNSHEFFCKKNLLQKYIQIYFQTLRDFLKIDKFVGSVSMGGWFMWYISFCLECSEKPYCRFLTGMALSSILFDSPNMVIDASDFDYLLKKPLDQSGIKRNLG